MGQPVFGFLLFHVRVFGPVGPYLNFWATLPFRRVNQIHRTEGGRDRDFVAVLGIQEVAVADPFSGGLDRECRAASAVRPLAGLVRWRGRTVSVFDQVERETADATFVGAGFVVGNLDPS